MFGLRTHRRSFLGAFTAAAVMSLLAASAGPTPAEEGDRPAASGLKAIGLDLDQARTLPSLERATALSQVSQALERSSSDLPSQQRGVAQFLAAELHFAQGEFEQAAREYEKAQKSKEMKPFADDASFSEIVSLQAAGHDEDAAKAWEKWEKRHGDSPLHGEAALLRAWNAIRRGEVEEAKEHLATVESQHAWMVEDVRYVLGKATIEFLEGRPDAALAALGKAEGAAISYLRALCHEAKGSMLKAASYYQEVAERYPESPLRDPALLANANTFLASSAYRSASEEFQRAMTTMTDEGLKAEASLRRAACEFLQNNDDLAADLFREVVTQYTGTDVAARAQFLLGEVMLRQDRYEDAILEFNRVLTSYFRHSVAASAQYRVGRCLDALGRHADATSSYEAVVSGYPLEAEAPAAAYLAGVGLLDQGKPLAAVVYFQLVLDRYASNEDDENGIVFASPEHQELVEAALCLLELSYHRAGDLGQLSGAPHLLLHKLPASRSPWRAYALLIDADALAAQGLYEESQTSLNRLFEEFPDHPAIASANQLLAWTYAQQGRDDLAISTEERMLETYGGTGAASQLSSAYLNIAHVRFNQKRYEDAAAAYEDFLTRFPGDKNRALALYQAALCYMRLGRTGDAVDRWETIVAEQPTAQLAEKSFARAGDLYFRTEHYEDAKRCYQGLLTNFANSEAAAVASLRLAQCDYNAGRNADALAAFAGVVDRFPGTPEATEAERGVEMALFNLGQEPGGSQTLAELIEKYPRSAFAADAQFQIAEQLYRNEQYREAADEFRRVVSQFPGYASADRAQFLMGDSYSQAGAPDEAKQAYEQFLVFFPESELRTTVNFRLGMIYFDEEDYVRTAVKFTSVLEQDAPPELRTAALFNLALCKRLIGQFDEAQADLEKYRELYPDDERSVDVAYQLGDLHETAGRLALAVEEFDLALKAGAHDAQAIELHYRVGRCQDELGNRDEALGAYRKAMASKDKQDAFRLSAVARIAAMYEETEEYDKAIVAYRDLVDHSTDPELVAAASERATELEAYVQ